MVLFIWKCSVIDKVKKTHDTKILRTIYFHCLEQKRILFGRDRLWWLDYICDIINQKL